MARVLHAWEEMAGVVAAQCCLCTKDLSTGAPKKKRKDLYGKAALESRLVLESFCLEKLGIVLAEVVEASGGKSFLCSLCSSELTRYSRIQEELNSLTSNITCKIQSFCSIAGISFPSCSSTASTSSSTTSSHTTASHTTPIAGSSSRQERGTRKRRASCRNCEVAGESNEVVSPPVQVCLFLSLALIMAIIPVYLGEYRLSIWK